MENQMRHHNKTSPLAQEKLACVIFGLAELDHLEEAVAAQNKGPLPEDGLDRLRAVYAKGSYRLAR